MPDDKKLTREELAAALEAKAKALRENKVSDDEVERMHAAGCVDCCGGCTESSRCGIGQANSCGNSCVSSSVR